MTTYTATFHASHCYAVEDIKARTSRQALEKARALYDRDMIDLEWCAFDPDCKPLEAISITGPDDASECWLSDDLLLQVAAADLFDALQQAVHALNTAPRFKIPFLNTDSYAIAATCDRALAKAKGGAA